MCGRDADSSSNDLGRVEQCPGESMLEQRRRWARGSIYMTRKQTVDQATASVMLSALNSLVVWRGRRGGVKAKVKEGGAGAVDDGGQSRRE
jgi:hypothetical protein